jgi:hypothetical protein
MAPENKDPRLEIYSAISALMMPPEAIEGAENEEFLADRDVWAKHAVEHLYAALKLLQ